MPVTEFTTENIAVFMKWHCSYDF